MSTLNPTNLRLFNDENRSMNNKHLLKSTPLQQQQQQNLVQKDHLLSQQPPALTEQQTQLVAKPTNNNNNNGKIQNKHKILADRTLKHVNNNKNQNNNCNNGNSSNNNSKKRKMVSTKPLSFEVFQEFEAQQQQPHVQKKRRLSVDSVDLVQESFVQDSSQDSNTDACDTVASAPVFASSNDVISWRQGVTSDYEQRVLQLKEEHTKALDHQVELYRELEQKFKVKESEASYFSFMYDSSVDQVKELETTVSDLNAKIEKMHKTQVNLAKQMGLKQAQIVSLQKESGEWKQRVEELEKQKQQSTVEQVDDLGIILREQIIAKKTEEVDELVFRNELLVQQIADLKKKSQRREDEFEKQRKEWTGIVDSMRQQMETGLKMSMQKIASLQKELAQKNASEEVSNN